MENSKILLSDAEMNTLPKAQSVINHMITNKYLHSECKLKTWSASKVVIDVEVSLLDQSQLGKLIKAFDNSLHAESWVFR